MKNSYSKKLSLLICGLLISPFNYAAESTPSNYYQDAHGNFIGYTHDQYNSIYEGYDASLFRDGWSGLMDANGNLKYADHPEHASILTKKTYYKNTDCSGTGYFSFITTDSVAIEPFNTQVIKNSHNKYIKHTVQTLDTYSSDSQSADMLSYSTLNANGDLVCTKTPRATIKQQIAEIEHRINNYAEYENDADELEFLQSQLRHTEPRAVAAVLDTGTDITNEYNWMGFRDHLNGSVSRFVKGIDYDAGIKFVENISPPTPPEELRYVRTSHDLSVRVQSNGSIGSASITQGPDIKISQLFAVKKSTGIYDVNIPETFLPKNRSVKNLQLQCSINVGAASLIPNANIGCYKLSNQNKIRVVTTLNENYYNSDFSLNIKY
ncbi:hypothetical protein AYY19_13955 [Photobacterium aquimaris]|uniref:Uncharacterized protein n=1 Tax=Photobacterium aquimaris TaxID=512643 RepID=A0A2T3IKD7_9GAMM|nr:hypothetical protein [Photobacterium aquimaris]OBU15662.1 hypothetical protein AYY20_06850 [Photobacterium aquimaris]OBU17341.1 hypothetical protein AYY19_13955 [Photobacterium aquimaris]PSU28784.1 hypothetical protein CTM88_10685 [Photobacterium aquimaris]PSW01594.1 hypothetical protein CTM91_08000 [Photobacterium aquimaris]